MAKKKPPKKKTLTQEIGEHIEIAGSGTTIDMPISDTLIDNYMPYAMSVIVSRALPEIDGFKPAHRKLLYTMYQMGLLTGARTKSANVVGQTMKLNPHGDIPIYETLVRLSRGNETLLHPYIDSKGNFGKSYSRDMAYAAARYTEVKLAPISTLLFTDIGKDTVDFVDNYDGTVKEPTLFPVSIPTILTNPNIGIAVAMSSAIPSFNLAEVCETTVALLKNPDHDIAATLRAPDFPGGGYYLYDEQSLSELFASGRASLRIRCKYEYTSNSIEITELPPTTTIETVMDKIADLVKQGRIKDITGMRDETDLRGLRLTLDLKRGTDVDALMGKLYRFTPLEDVFPCNTTILIDGAPQTIGVRELLLEWIRFRRNAIKRRTQFTLQQKKDRLHLLNGLSMILLDIDKAIHIIRDTKEEKEVIPNLIIGFGIDEVQANYIAEIRLRHLNREYVLSRTAEQGNLKEEIAELEEIIRSTSKIDRIIMEEQAEAAKKFVQPRRTRILYETGSGEAPSLEEDQPNYPVTVFFTRDGYFKKITKQSLRMSAEQKLKEGDEVITEIACGNTSQLLFFTNERQVYKCSAYQFPDTKASALGDYVANTLLMPEGEYAVAMAVTDDYSGDLLFFYEDGKVARVPFSAYETQSNRKKLANAYSERSALLRVIGGQEEKEFVLLSSSGRMLLCSGLLIPSRTTRNTIGVAVMTQRKNAKLSAVHPAEAFKIRTPSRFRTRNLPAAGAILKEGDLVPIDQTLSDEPE